MITFPVQIPHPGRLRQRTVRFGCSLLAAWLFQCAFFASGWAPTRQAGPYAHAQSIPLPEYQVKAAFLFNFIKFVEWPGATGPSATTPFCIGILGKDSFGRTLEAVQANDDRWRQVTIKRFRRVEEAKECDLLFIGASEGGRLAQILRYLQKTSVLTVADLDGFCEAGGMINLVAAKNKVSFEINPEAARRTGLRIKSQLLKLAKITPEGER